ncbi:MAG: hypothetical protein NTW60_01105 [Candidatus Wolfebacteria bacterium]|nr:hypothetical protein [Candidatus Wolfebacteria bacterium]
MNDRSIYHIILIIMKGENRLKILEFLEDSAHAVGDLLFIFSLPYGSSMGRMKHLLNRRHQEMDQQKINSQEKQRFRELLYHLRKDGLIEETKKENDRFLKLTQRGKIQLEKLRLSRSDMLPRSKYEYKKEDILKIVIFDIPEREKRKRNWLRAVLSNLDFKILQKSVWVGKTKLPKEFVVDLRNLNLTDYVEIFAVNKIGSLKQLKF